MAFEARLPPLQPKVSAKLTMLAAANGSLFAGPAVGGGLLQWGRPEGNMRRPLDVEGQHVRQVGAPPLVARVAHLRCQLGGGCTLECPAGRVGLALAGWLCCAAAT